MKINDVILKESEESDELVAEFLGYLDQHNYWEAFNSLIGAYDTNADCLQVWHSDVQAVKSEVIKGLLHVIKHEPDLPVDAIIADMYADLKWPELLTIQKAMQHNKQPVGEASDADADPVIGYVKEMYADLKSGFAGMIVLQLRDYVYDTGSPENLAQSILEIEPGLPALINQHKNEIVKNMLEIIKKDFDHSQRVLLPVFEVLHHLGIDWPEIARIKAGLTQGYKTESVSEDDELSMGQQQLQRMAANHIMSAIQNRRWMSLLDTTQTVEQEKWNLDSRYGFPEKLAQYKTDIIKSILQAVKDPRWFNPDLVVAVKGLKRTGVDWPELDQILAGLQYGKVSEAWSKKYKRSIDCSHPKGFSQKAHCAGRRKHKANEDLTATNEPETPAYVRFVEKKLQQDLRNIFAFVIELTHEQRMTDPVFNRQMLAVFNNQKPEIIKYLLNYIKHRDSDNVKWLVQAMFKIGLLWPELKTIQQALAHGNKTESVSEADDSEGFKILSDIMMRDYADNKVRGFWYMMYHLDDWNMTVDQFPEFDQIIAEIKPDIIKSLLKAVRADTDGEAIANVLHSIDRMHKCGVLWPELNQIKSGLEHNRKTEPLDENQYKQAEAETAARQVSAKLEKASKLIGNPSYDNHKMTFWEALWTISTIGPGYRQIFTPILDHYKPSIMLHILKLAKAGNTEAVERATEILNNTHIQWPELHTIHKALTHGKKTESVTENKYKQAEAEQYASLISSKLEQASKLQGNPNYDSHMMYFLEAMLKVGQIGPGYGQILTPILEHYKPVIIRHLLLLLKQNKQNKLSAVENILENLFNIHIQWPELETIKKALAHGKQHTAEATDVSKDPFDKWTRRFANDLENRVYWHFAMVLEELAKHMNVGTMRVSEPQWQRAAVQLDLNTHKREIIHSILKNLQDSIRMNSSSNWLLNSMIAQKLILNKLGADWPELDTIVAGVSNNQVNN